MSFETPMPPYNASDPYATFLSASLFDLLMIEMVPLSYRLAALPPRILRTRIKDRPRRVKTKKKPSQEIKRSSEDTASRSETEKEETIAAASSESRSQSDHGVEEGKEESEGPEDEEEVSSSSEDEMMAITGPGTDGMAGYAGTAGPDGEGEELERERAYKRCEGWGYRVGQGAVERLVCQSL